jgi:hypothetical protein
MRRLEAILLVTAFLVVILAPACAPQPAQEVTNIVPTPEKAQETASIVSATEKEYEDFDPQNFDNPTEINNPYFPMKPGARYVYEGFTEEEGEKIPHRLEFTVTDLTKEIGGVRSVVAWVLDYMDDELVEKEIAFFAQDNDGTVWYLGEHPEDWEGGSFVEAPTWIHGIEGAVAGIRMMAKPQPGTPSFSAGWGPEVDFMDRGQVSEIASENCVPVDCYKDVLVIEEFTAVEPNAFQTKYYAPGVGNIRVGWKGEDAQKEELELVEYVQLSPDDLAEYRDLALELEQHAYEISQDVYGQTSPSQ